LCAFNKVCCVSDNEYGDGTDGTDDDEGDGDGDDGSDGNSRKADLILVRKIYQKAMALKEANTYLNAKLEAVREQFHAERIHCEELVTSLTKKNADNNVEDLHNEQKELEIKHIEQIHILKEDHEALLRLYADLLEHTDAKIYELTDALRCLHSQVGLGNRCVMSLCDGDVIIYGVTDAAQAFLDSLPLLS
jgi:hypothetical protein